MYTIFKESMSVVVSMAKHTSVFCVIDCIRHMHMKPSVRPLIWKDSCPPFFLAVLAFISSLGFSCKNQRSRYLPQDSMSSEVNNNDDILRILTFSQTLVSPTSKSSFNAIPVIDFSLRESEPPKYFEQLRSALEDVGFGIFINVPGFEQSFQDEAFSLAAKFYGRPPEWKRSLGTENSMALRGYFRCDETEGPHKV